MCSAMLLLRPASRWIAFSTESATRSSSGNRWRDAGPFTAGQSRGVSADGSGEWVIDWDPAQPKPAPFTTIAWRTVHTAGTNYLYWEYAFGSASPTFDLELPGNAADATQFLSDSQRQVTQTLASLTESDLDKMVRHTSGGQRSVYRILAGLINEQVHHGAEISLLRDLYRYRSSLTTPNAR